MSDRLTSIHLPGMRAGAGIADWGRRDSAYMIKMYREMAEMMLKEANEILSASDDDFRIQTYLGVHVRRNVEVIQEGRK